MTRLVLRRLAWSVPMLLVITLLSFVLVSLIPGDTARAILGPSAAPEQIDAVRAQLGLDQPLLQQYLSWLGRAIRGDLGSSLLTGVDVSQLVNARLAPTLSLITLATLSAGVIGVTLGVQSAVRGGRLGRLVDLASMSGLAVPGFALALLLVAVFAVRWPLFPATGYVDFASSPGQWLHALVLPVAAACPGAATAVAKQARDATLDVLDREFVRVMQANGVPRRTIIYRHVLRNAAGPVVSLLGVVSASLLGAAVLIENVFALPGLGSAAAVAASQHDLPVLQGAVVYFTLIVIVIGLLVDLVQAWLDPKVRLR
ncbi:ABC transporter permease [Catellatospora sp. KI3]|uniref:ABC transporter permease n=1 Tax=Catellatospora sp. KI3 TaxID=3041620 RepID=UPI002482C77F|nr:ABC transporter permease [Catellatospora sp. KI3]MDI1461456.1 ABC transporter permease [Catellatospora sp. KI3]